MDKSSCTPKSKVRRHNWSPLNVVENSSPLSPPSAKRKHPEEGVLIMKKSETDKTYGGCFGSQGNKSHLTPKRESNSTNIFSPLINNEGYVSGFPLPEEVKSESDCARVPKPKVRVSSSRVMKTQAPQLGLNHSVNADHLMTLVEDLKEEISALKLGLSKSENIRKVMELKLAKLQEAEKLILS